MCNNPKPEPEHFNGKHVTEPKSCSVVAERKRNSTLPEPRVPNSVCEKERERVLVLGKQVLWSQKRNEFLISKHRGMKRKSVAFENDRNIQLGLNDASEIINKLYTKENKSLFFIQKCFHPRTY